MHTIPIEHTDPVNAQILAISEDLIAGFHRHPFHVIAEKSGVDLPTVIERIARLTDPALPDEAIPYVTGVTRVWCAFFVVNGAIALWTALAASDATWALYNGAISYVLIGALLLGERLVRPRHGR